MNLSQESIEKIIVGIVTAIVILILSEWIKSTFKKMGEGLDKFIQALGFGVAKRYYNILAVGRENLKLIGAYEDRERPPKLENVYISLKLDSESDARSDDWIKVFRKPKKQIAIKGMPGSGKTTLLDYLILVMTGRIKHPLKKELGNLLPIYVRLRKLKRLSLKEFIGTRDHCEEEIPWRFFEKRLDAGKCMILFDGLDEILDEKDKEHAVRQIGMFAKEYGANWMIVTSRPAGWSKQYFPDFEDYDIQDLGDDAVRKFIGDWYRVVKVAEARKDLPEKPGDEQIRRAERAAERSASEEAGKLFAALSKNQGLLKVSRRPLMLVLITLVYKYQHSLPQGRAELYKECLKILLDTWEDKKEIDSPIRAIPPKDKQSILMVIAFEFLQREILQMKAADLEALAGPLLSERKIQMSAEEFIRQISSRSGILVDFGVNEYGFAHRALQDRLAADYIVDEKLTDLLLERAEREEWREVILIAIGLVTKDLRSSLLKALLEHGGESAAGLAMAGWSLAEGIQVEPALRVEVTRKLAARLTDAKTSSDFALLSAALTDTDPAAMQDWIGNVLSGRDPTLQKRVLASLIPDLGLEAAKPFLPTLTKFLADPRAEASLRAQCALTIAKLKPTPDAELWNALFSASRDQYDEVLKRAATWAYCELGRYEELGLVKIPAGEFLMGSADSDRYADDEEKPQHTLFLSDYYIAKYPVTVQEYQNFVNGSGYKTSNERSLKGEANHPVVNVTWKDTLVFARWHGLTLPSEAEWEKAARGIDGRIYPWGNDWRNGVANTSEYWDKGARGLWSKLRRRDYSSTTPVGSFPQGNSPFGCADMAGNVWEWTRSVLKEYPYDANDGREDENVSGRRALRGGSFINNQRLARCAVRNGFIYDLNNNYGFRVCASPNLS